MRQRVLGFLTPQTERALPGPGIDTGCLHWAPHSDCPRGLQGSPGHLAGQAKAANFSPLQRWGDVERSHFMEEQAQEMRLRVVLSPSPGHGGGLAFFPLTP